MMSLVKISFGIAINNYINFKTLNILKTLFIALSYKILNLCGLDCFMNSYNSKF